MPREALEPMCRVCTPGSCDIYESCETRFKNDHAYVIRLVKWLWHIAQWTSNLQLSVNLIHQASNALHACDRTKTGSNVPSPNGEVAEGSLSSVDEVSCLRSPSESARVSEDWHGKMTAKAAWKQGIITREEFVAIRKAAKLRKIMMEEKPQNVSE